MFSGTNYPDDIIFFLNHHHLFTSIMKHFDMYKRIILFCGIISLMLCNSAKAQLIVTNNQTAAALASTLVGPGVTISNPTLYCATGANGKFTSINTSLVGIDSGILLTSGSATAAAGLASTQASVTTFTGSDPDLVPLTMSSANDVCRLEFDFVPAGDTVKFDYIFASEEHPLFWCGSVNDAFGFFISGPGITGTQNIALVPGTNIPVTINSVNGSTSPGIACTSMGTGSPFTMYYTNNQTSTTIAYNGMTHLFTAISPVIPCSTYHLKLAVCDGGDTIYDSGVFLKQGSLSSTPIAVNSQGGSLNNIQGLSTPHPYAVRNCLSGSFKFERPVATPNPHTIHFIIGGSAVNGSDYLTIADSVTIAANQTQASVYINAVSPPSGTDSVTLYILANNICNGQSNIADSVKLWIFDSLQAWIVTPDTTICPGQSIQLIGYGDTLLSYSWSPTTNLSSSTVKSPWASPTSTITYQLTATLPGSTCPAVHDNVTITVPAAPAGPTSNSPVCLGQTINIYGPTMNNATYSWTGPNGFTSSLQNPTILAANSSHTGYYELTVTSGGCTFPPVGVNITVNNPPNVTASSNSPVCVGQTLNLTCNVSNATSYTWTGPNNFTSNVQNPSITGVTTAAGGLYSVTVVGQNGCTASPATTFVIINNLGTSPIPSNNGPLCVGQTLNLTATPVNGATYNWTGPNGFSSTQQNPSITGITLPGAGTYTVTATVNGCASLPATTNVVVNPAPTITTTSFTNPTGCNVSDGTITINGLSAGTYTVTYLKNGVSQPSAPFAASNGSITITGLGAGSYTNFTITMNGCSATYAGPIVLVDPSAPPAPTAGSNSPLCEGQTLNLTSTTVTGALYQWTGPGGYTSNQQNPSITGITIAQAGNYSVVANLNGCLSQPGIVNVVVDPIPVTPTAGSNSPVCSGNALNLSANTTTTGVTYTWTGPNSYSVTGQQNPTIPAVTTAAAGTYTVTAAVGNCVSAPGTAIVVVNQTPGITATYNNPTVCGGNDGSITLSGLSAGNFTINYTKNSSAQPAIITPSNNGSVVIPNLTAGSYTNITVSYNGCPSNIIGPILLTDPNAPASPVAGNTGPVCEGASLTLTASNVAGATFIWTGPNSFTDTNQNATIPSITLTGAGVYSVVANVNGCNSLPATTTVVVNPSPAAPTATSNSPVCQGFDIQLSTPAIVGANYNWTGPNGFTSNQQNPLVANAQPADAGNYILTITSGTACASLPDTAFVIVQPTPPPPVVNSPTELCQLDIVQLTAQGQNLLWYTSQTGGVGVPGITPPTTTSTTMTYYVSQTINGCEGPRVPLVVIVKPQPQPPAAQTDYTFCQHDTTATQLTATGNNLLWYDVAVGGTPLVGAPTPNTAIPGVFHYYVTQTDSSCESNRTDITVTIHPKPDLPQVEQITVCQDDPAPVLTAQGQDLLWYSSMTGGTGSAVAPVINTADTGVTDYYVSQTINGCEGDRSLIRVTINPKVIASFDVSTDKACVDKPITVTFTGSGPNTSNYVWDFDGADNVTGAGAGPYTVSWGTEGDKIITVTITNLNCSSGASKTIDVDPTPGAHFDLPADVCVDEVVKVQAGYDLINMPEFTWNFGDAQVLEGTGFGPYSLMWNGTGQKIVSLALTGINCPSDPFFDTVNVHQPLAKVESISSDDICTADSVLFTAKPGLDYTYQWAPAVFFKDEQSTGLSAWGRIRKSGYVWLTVTDRWGCQAIDSLLMTTKSCCDVFLPNAFTPNGDGKNDIFRLVTKGNQEISAFQVMDRWGKRVFESVNQNEGWDGTFNGEAQDMGTYKYYLKYRCADSKEMVEMKGDVILLR